MQLKKFFMVHDDSKNKNRMLFQYEQFCLSYIHNLSQIKFITNYSWFMSKYHTLNFQSSSHIQTKQYPNLGPSHRKTISYNHSVLKRNPNPEQLKKYYSYKQENFSFKNPGVSISKSPRYSKVLEPDQTPGPGQYNFAISKKSFSLKFSKSHGHQDLHNQISATHRIGPGQYNLKSHSNYQQEEKRKLSQFHYTIGTKSKSIFDRDNNQSPGPSDYKIFPVVKKYPSKSLDKSFGTSKRFKDDQISPGPSEYIIKINGKKSINRKRTISNTGRELSRQQQIQSPGPLHYNLEPIVQLELKKFKGISIPRTVREQQKVEMLTKESYNKYKIIRDFDVEFNKGRGFTIFQSNEKSKLKKKFITPSPQEYKPKIPTKHQPSLLFNSKSMKKFSNSPGPGSYETAHEKGIKYSFGRSKSVNTFLIEETPGVGQYNILTEQIRNRKKLIKKQKIQEYKKFIDSQFGTENSFEKRI